MTDEFQTPNTPVESNEPAAFAECELSIDAQVPTDVPSSDEEPTPTPAQVLKDTRRAYSRCGWAVAALTLFLTVVFPNLLTITLLILKSLKADSAFSAFLQDNLLYLNEAIILIGMLIGLLVFCKMPKQAPERKPITPIFFLFCIALSIAMGFVGSMKSSTLLSIWQSFTGIGTENGLTVALSATDVFQMILCTTILAPVIEEWFFRKLLIDRMHRYGELTAILFSGVAFALYHGNFDQLYYTLGLGLLFAYFYCRTGSYLGAVFLHMVFNFFAGVLPTLLSTELPIETLESFLNAPSISLLKEVLVPMLLYLLYLTVYYGAVVVGIIFFFIHLKKLR